MFPSCGCSQLSRVVGTGPRLSRSMLRASSSACANDGSSVRPVATRVVPIAPIILSCGHSTTVTKGYMYSFLAIAAPGEPQCTTVGRR